MGEVGNHEDVCGARDGAVDSGDKQRAPALTHDLSENVDGGGSTGRKCVRTAVGELLVQGKDLGKIVVVGDARCNNLTDHTTAVQHTR